MGREEYTEVGSVVGVAQVLAGNGRLVKEGRGGARAWGGHREHGWSQALVHLRRGIFLGYVKV